MTRNRSFSDRENRSGDGDATDRPTLDPWAIGIGGLIVATAASSLLDDTTTLHHPWWSVLVAAALVACVYVVAQTLQRLLATGHEASSPLEE